MAIPPAPVAVPDVAELRRRIARLEKPRVADGAELATAEFLTEALVVRAGAAYSIDSATLALALMSAPSSAGAWCAVIGVDDFGIEAAGEWGIDLHRTIVVPDPEEQWLEATAAIVDVVDLVVLKPPPGARVSAGAAERLAARLRERSCALVVWGEWPRTSARLRLAEVSWAGLEIGAGLLRERRVEIEVQRGAAPARRVLLSAGTRPAPVPTPARRAG